MSKIVTASAFLCLKSMFWEHTTGSIGKVVDTADFKEMTGVLLVDRFPNKPPPSPATLACNHLSRTRTTTIIRQRPQMYRWTQK